MRTAFSVFLLCGMFLGAALLARGADAVHTEAEILSALERRVRWFSPDTIIYLSDEEKEMMRDFLNTNQELFDSLGKQEAFYYRKLVEQNRKPYYRENYAMLLSIAYMEFYDAYSPEEKAILDETIRDYKLRFPLARIPSRAEFVAAGGLQRKPFSFTDFPLTNPQEPARWRSWLIAGAGVVLTLILALVFGKQR